MLLRNLQQKVSMKNVETQDLLNTEEALNNWTVPAVPPSQIYKFGTFDFKGR